LHRLAQITSPGTVSPDVAVLNRVAKECANDESSDRESNHAKSFRRNFDGRGAGGKDKEKGPDDADDDPWSLVINDAVSRKNSDAIDRQIASDVALKELADQAK